MDVKIVQSWKEALQSEFDKPYFAELARELHREKAEGKVIFQGTVLLFGDVNGDGNLRMSDMIKVRNHILETQQLTGIGLAAADCNHDGNIRMSDMIKIRNEILGTGTIVQTGN